MSMIFTTLPLPYRDILATWNVVLINSFACRVFRNTKLHGVEESSTSQSGAQTYLTTIAFAGDARAREDHPCDSIMALDTSKLKPSMSMSNGESFSY